MHMPEEKQIEVVDVINPDDPKSIMMIYIIMMVVTFMQGIGLVLILQATTYLRIGLIFAGQLVAFAIHFIAMWLIKNILKQHQ